MASAGLNDSEIQEYFDSQDDIIKNVKKLTDFIQSSKHVVVYTGAGISTSAGIPDFRGPSGIWTLHAKGLKENRKSHVEMPTLTHMAIKKLIDSNIVKYLVSQNVDGLHIKSGVNPSRIAELHGNTNKEFCPKCKKVFFRDFHTRSACDAFDHRTRRYCDACNSELFDSIVNFNESLPDQEFHNAMKNSKKCDLAIVLGTSMRVTPACNLPSMRKKNGKLVICNLQKTPFDDEAEILIHAKTDHIMSLLMENLSIPIPEYIHELEFKVSISEDLKLLTIFDSSVNFREMFNSFYILDSQNNKCQLTHFVTVTGEHKHQSNLRFYKNRDVIKMIFEVNVLNPISAEIKITERCKVVIKINTTQNSFSHQTIQE